MFIYIIYSPVIRCDLCLGGIYSCAYIIVDRYTVTALLVEPDMSNAHRADGTDAAGSRRHEVGHQRRHHPMINTPTLWTKARPKYKNIL